MIRSMRIHAFKAWRDTGRFELGPITGLFGTNSSGKSSILHLLLLLKKTTETSDRSLVLDFGDGRTPPTLGSFIDALHRHDPSYPMGWEINWDLPQPLTVPGVGKHGPIAASVLTQKSSVVLRNEAPFANGLVYALGDVAFELVETPSGSGVFELNVRPETSYRLQRSRGRPPSLPGPINSYGYPDEVKAYFQNTGFLADFELAFERLLGNVLYLGPLREHPQRQYIWGGQKPASVGERGERAVDVLLAAEQKKERVPPAVGNKRPETLAVVVASWLKKLELIHDFRVEPVRKGSRIYEVRVRKSAGAAEVLLTDVGFGVSQILPVIVQAFAAPAGSVVILEQPEIHLHPAVQAGLADVLIDAWQRKGVQFIVESHSEHLLLRLQRRIAEEAIGSNDVRLYFAHVDDGEHRLSKLDLDLFGHITNWPLGFFGDQLGEAAAMTKAVQRRRRTA